MPLTFLLLAFLSVETPNTEALLRAVNADLTAQLTLANTVAHAQATVARVQQQGQQQVSAAQQKAEVAHKAAMDLVAAEAKKCPSGEIDVQAAACKPKPQEPKK